jgi:hypothetical protein
MKEFELNAQDERGINEWKLKQDMKGGAAL